METRKTKGMQLFEQGYNCSQAVVLAYADVFEMDEEQLAKMAVSFGGGMGRMREVCGTVSGMCMVAGMLIGPAKPDPKKKGENYEMVQKLAKEFEKRNGSIICRELLGLGANPSVIAENYQTGTQPEPRSGEYYQKRPCKQLVGEACEILEKILLTN